MARQRNYRAEYVARLQRAEARGLTRKEGRGHAGDLLKRTPPTAHASPIYNTERGAKGYVSRLGANRRVKIQAVYDNGASVTVLGQRGGQRAATIGQEELDLLAEQKRRGGSGRAAHQAGAGNAAHDQGPMARPAPQQIGYQVIWT